MMATVTYKHDFTMCMKKYLIFRTSKYIRVNIMKNLFHIFIVLLLNREPHKVILMAIQRFCIIFSKYKNKAFHNAYITVVNDSLLPRQKKFAKTG